MHLSLARGLCCLGSYRASIILRKYIMGRVWHCLPATAPNNTNFRQMNMQNHETGHVDNDSYSKGSISLGGAVAMGTGVMIGAGIFALTGQIAQLAGPLFPLAFIAGAIVTSFSAYSYIKMSNAWPSAGGIAMILQKCYGAGAVAAGAGTRLRFVCST